ncbi:hypothetical protein KCP69_19115 [Salmonella enterica subsp. enterica]|nr:hypothetical protein KCP69_19115 [Salmonella enterica subsp. enterica]
MAFVFTLQRGIAYRCIGILHGGNARHLPLMPQVGFSFIIPVQRGVLLVPALLSLRYYALPAPSHPAGPSGVSVPGSSFSCC